jgi:hypothetical protein
MNAQTFTPDNVREWLQYSPAEPGPMAATLRGFIVNTHFYCVTCCGRLSGRGIILPRESRPVWKDMCCKQPCEACGKLT